MPKEYTAIRDYYLKKGASDKDAKTRAAKIFISRGKGKAGRSKRAKELHKD